MGSYLTTPNSAPPPLAQGRRTPGPRPAPAQDGLRRLHSGRCLRTGPFPEMPPDWEPAKPQRMVPEAWRRLPPKLPPKTIMGPDLSGAWESYMKRWLWSARHPRRIWSPVTIKITPPERSGSPRASSGPGVRSAGRPPYEERPDPCAKETVLRALSQCKKGNRKFDGPLWFEIPESTTSRRRNKEPKPSAFKPLIKNGVVPSFVPRPGPLNRSLLSCNYNVCKENADPGLDVLSGAPPTAGTGQCMPQILS
ncbi:POM121-like protein 12 [Equus asinus]|uniref:POM121-like protein 12 n=1 Tax=Equus asinus TaxID=9793 RepID=UPI0038F7D388